MKRLCALLLVSALTVGCLTADSLCRADAGYSSVKSIARYLLVCAEDLDEEISFSYTRELDAYFRDEEALNTLLSNAGLYRWYYSIDTSSRRVRVDRIEYRMGFRIARLVKMGQEYRLTETESNVLMEMEWLVEEARMYAQSPFDLLVRLHDEISYRAEYANYYGAFGTWDSVLGVMGMGEADCDGYSDAFFLAGTLAGFQVGFQQGMADGGPHMWNLVSWDGAWYHVDVTWDDIDYENDPFLTRYSFLMPGGYMMYDHAWDEALSPYSHAWGTDWDMYYYTADPNGLTYGAYYESTRDAADYIVWKRAQTGGDRLHVMVEGGNLSGAAFNDRLTDAGLVGRWTTWAQPMNEYTCFTVLMLE